MYVEQNCDIRCIQETHQDKSSTTQKQRHASGSGNNSHTSHSGTTYNQMLNSVLFPDSFEISKVKMKKFSNNRSVYTYCFQYRKFFNILF